MSSPHERLKIARQKAGFSTATEAARRFGWPPATYLGHENGSRGFSADTAEDYSAKFKVSPQWLLFGGDDTPAAAPEVMGGGHLVPVYDVAASAGNGSIVEDEPVAHSLAFPPSYLRWLTKSNPRHLSIISVKGDSMEPTLRDDDIVMLDSSKTDMSYDGMFVLRFNDALHVKRISRSGRKGHVLVVADNRDIYPPQEYAVTDIKVLGKVIWYGKKV